MENIIVIGSSWVIAKYLSLAVQSLGYNPIFFGNLDFYSSEVRTALERCETHVVNINDPEAIIAEIKKANIERIAAVTSLADSKLPVAIEVARRLGVPGPDLALEILAKKSEVATLIPEYSPRTLRFCLSELTQDTLSDFREGIRSFVLKPSQGSGALATFIFEDDRLSIERIMELTKGPECRSFLGKEWVLQERVTGELYSLEGYFENGKMQVLGFSKRSRIQLTETANWFPVANRILAIHRDRMLESVEILAKKAGYQGGYFHCEFLVNKEKFALIDANFGRIGGGGIIEQLALLTGKSEIEVAAHSIQVGTAGLKVNNPIHLGLTSEELTLSLNYGVKKTAKIYGITKNSATCAHTMICKEGSHVTEFGIDDYCWVGILAGKKEQVLREIKMLAIETDAGVVSAHAHYDDLP